MVYGIRVAKKSVLYSPLPYTPPLQQFSIAKASISNLEAEGYAVPIWQNGTYSPDSLHQCPH